MKTHGHAGKVRSSEYVIWRGIKQRCEHPKRKDYMIFTFWPYEDECYGITIKCDRWWDGLQVATMWIGFRPARWKQQSAHVYDSMLDYETRWIGSAAQSAANLQMQYRKCKKGAKWVTL